MAAGPPWYCAYMPPWMTPLPECVVTQPGAGQAPSAPQAVAQAAADASNPFGAAMTTLTSPGTWMRVGVFTGAILLLIIGFIVVATPPQQAQS